MKTPKELKEYLNLHKRNGAQVMLNIALKDLLEANTEYISRMKYSSTVINIAVERIVSRIVGGLE